jgi:hypothetical protein
MWHGWMWHGWIGIGIGIGAFALGVGLFDWSWYMESPRAQFLVDRLGRRGTRVLLIVFGVAELAAGITLLARS